MKLYCSFSTRSTHQISWGAKKVAHTNPVQPTTCHFSAEHHPSFSFCLNASSSSELAVFIVCWTKTALMIFKTAKPQIAMSKHQFLARSGQVISQSPCSTRATLLQKNAQHDVFICFPLLLFAALAGFVPGGSNRLWANWFSNHIASCINSTPT